MEHLQLELSIRNTYSHSCQSGTLIVRAVNVEHLQLELSIRNIYSQGCQTGTLAVRAVNLEFSQSCQSEAFDGQYWQSELLKI